MHVGNIKGFAPIADKSAKVLILGSMPSQVSLQKKEYYGHKRNAFWPIMMSFIDQKTDHEISYYHRKKLLIENHIAVWDVMKSCVRPGSLDHDINMNSIKINDFKLFFGHHTDITSVLFNGTLAEKVYIKFVLSQMKETTKNLKYVRLPSTSPAHAAISLKKKTEVWKEAMAVDLLV